MNTNEIRKGNFCYTEKEYYNVNNQILKIVGFDKQQEFEGMTEIIRTEKIIPDKYDIYLDYNFWADYILPYETDEKWAKILGFIESSKIKGDFQKGNYLLRNVNFGNAVNPDFCWALEFNSEKSWYSLGKCKYVHLLQNLYYALTGSELVYSA